MGDNLCDFDFARLVMMLFSGLVTAVLVIAINEGLSWFKLCRKRRGVLLLLICELAANESVLTNHMEEIRRKETTFRYTVWEKSCIDVADFLSQRNLAELSATYDLLRKIEVNPNHPTNCQKALSLMRRLKLRLEPLADVAQGKKDSQPSPKQ